MGCRRQTDPLASTDRPYFMAAMATIVCTLLFLALGLIWGLSWRVLATGGLTAVVIVVLAAVGAIVAESRGKS